LVKDVQNQIRREY